jgi:predicted GNAT family acetyltransferase
MSAEIVVADRPEAGRYEISVDGKLVGFVTYRLAPGEISFPHTEINPAKEGQGLGSRLVAYALDDARVRGLAVHPVCPFVAAYIEDHLEYGDLVAEQDRARLGL